MPVFLPNKNTPPPSFQQIERRTLTQWQQVGSGGSIVQFKANWANTGSGFQVCRFLLDFYGFVHLAGVAAYSGTITNGSTSTIFTLPSNVSSVTWAPALTEQFPTKYGSLIQVDNAGNVKFVNGSGGSLVNPQPTLSGISWTVF